MTQHTLPLPFQTERLVLRRPSPQNAVAVQKALEESFADLHVWMEWAATLQSLEETQAVLERAQASFEAGEDFAVHAFLRDTGRFVLSAGLHPRNRRVPSFEIGYWCRTSLQGSGYVTEVVRELTAMAFRDLEALRVEIRCDARNQRSRRVAERAGFRLEAELRWDDRANDGSLRDTTVYVLLAEHFQPDTVSQSAFVP